MYCVAWVNPDRSVAKGDHFAFTIDLTDGSQIGNPILLDGATYNPSEGLPAQHFGTVARKQRAALLLATVQGRKTLFVPASSVMEFAGTNRRWLIAIDVENWQIAATWTSTVKGSGGGIWHAGAGPAADNDGFVYPMTGNGSFVELRPWSLGIRLRDQPEGARRYQVIADAPADGRSVRELHLDDDLWISLIVRDGRSLPVRADTPLRAGDEVLVLTNPDTQTDIARIFTRHTHNDPA